jgi:multicomponent Na+:H+ antiporter subunit F
MADFLIAAAILLLAIVALGLARILFGPSTADRIMAAQLLGTGGVGALLLSAQAIPTRGVVDMALVLALLAAFVSIAFVKAADRARSGGER